MSIRAGRGARGRTEGGRRTAALATVRTWACAALAVVPGVVPWGPATAQEAPRDDFIERRIETILGREWDYKTISSGRNFPAVPVRREHRGEFMILLHEGFSPEHVRSYFDWTEVELARRLEELEKAELIRRSGERWVPTVAVISAGDDPRHFPLPEPLVSRTVAAMEAVLPEVRRLYGTSPGLARVPFENASLYVLSDVLLDDIQIDYVEDRFLGAERPLRAGSRFYYSIREDIPWDSIESFGVYGNSIRSYGAFSLGVYGNRRQGNPMNFMTLDADAIEARFGIRPDTVASFKKEALAHVVALARDPSHTMPRELLRGFGSLGWVEDGKVVIPVLGPADQEVVDRMALAFTDDLLAIMEEYRPALVEAHRDSPYGDEITFEEYFIWWYHKYYSRVTDRLVASGHIVVPEAGIASYMYAPAEDAPPGS